MMELSIARKAKFTQVLENYIVSYLRMYCWTRSYKSKKEAQVGQIKKCALVVSRMIADKENLADIGIFISKKSKLTEETGEVLES